MVSSIDPEDPEGARVRLKKFADCGIFTREQLSHTLSTRATKGLTLPYEAYFRGRCFLINELIATCSSGETEPVEVADVLEAGLEALKGRDLGAATVTSDGRSAGVNVEDGAKEATDVGGVAEEGDHLGKACPLLTVPTRRCEKRRAAKVAGRSTA